MKNFALLLALAFPAWVQAQTIEIDDNGTGFAASGSAAEGAIVLMYHGLDEDFGFNPASFNVQMQYLHDNGYNTITMDHLQSWIETGEPALPDKPVVLTFDDNYITVYTVAFPALQTHGFTGINYTHTNYVGIMTGNDHCDWIEIQEMETAGVIFTESHTRSHTKLTLLSGAALDSELAGSKADIEANIVGKTCRHLAYPYGGFNTPVILATANAGFETAVTTIPGIVTREANLLEIPRFTVNPNTAGSGTELNSQFLNAVGSLASTGGWDISTAVPGYIGEGYHFAYAGTGESVATWTFTGAPPGRYEVFAHWTANPNRATNAPYTIYHTGGETTIPMNQRENHARWVSLGTYSFDVYTPPTIQLTDDADGVVVADAVRVVQQSNGNLFILY